MNIIDTILFFISYSIMIYLIILVILCKLFISIMDTLFGLGSFMKDVIDTKDDIKKMLEKLTILISRF
jgi:type III secretory pathway component EscU